MLDLLVESLRRRLAHARVGRLSIAPTEDRRAPGVAEVHDLHVWEVTSGFPALSAHILVKEHADCHEKRYTLEDLLHQRFGIQQTTLQVDQHQPELLSIHTATRPANSDANH